MSWNGISPSCLTLGLLIGWCFITTLHAQGFDPCFEGGNFDISFPEETIGTTHKVSDTDQSYVIEVRTDYTSVSNKYPFSEYFVVEYNPVQRFQYIRMIKPIDRDGPTSGLDDDINILQFQVLCTPPDDSTRYSILKIQITDTNDNPPVFVRPPYITSISELIPVGQIFYRDIVADDKDEGRNKQLQYSLSDHPGAMFPGANDFAIAIVGEGLVEVSRVLDFERMYRATGNRADLCYYNLTVTSSDQGTISRSSTTSFLIYIEDDDDLGPEFVYPTCVNSAEMYGQNCIRARYLSNLQPTSSQTLVFTPYPADTNNPSATVDIIAQDRDTLNSPIICRIAQTLPAGFEQYFSVSAAQIGQTKQYRCVVTYSPVNNTPLNRNNVQSLDIIIQAIEDNTVNRRQETATISVNLVQTNTGPPVITPSSAAGYIYENSPSGTLVSQDRATTTALRLTFSDPDLSPSDPVPQYNIQVTGGPFTVTPAGYVQLQMSMLDYEQTQQYTLTVTITDPATPADKATGTYTVNVLDVNDLNPIFTANYDVTIQEGNYAQNPQVLVTVTATDGDFGPVTYSKMSVSPAASDSKFSVVSNTGAVSLQGTVQANEVYFINIRANDSGTPQRSTDTVVVVRVTPLGNQKPSFSASRYIIYVSEDVPVNTALFLLQATDPDTDSSRLTYSVTSEAPATNSFFVNNTVLSNSRTFDRESIAEYNVTVGVSDPQSNTGRIIVTIVILDVNDNSPQFALNNYTFQIIEGPRADSFVGNVSATDRDAPGTGNSAVSYSIFFQFDSSDFTIDPTTGRISSTRSFDYEAQKRYVIVVRATDAGASPRYSDVVVNVDILDIQDEVRLFETTSVEVTVREDVGLNVPILRLPVSNADSIKNITLKLTSTNCSPLTIPFSVQLDNNNAAISVTTRLNYEDQQLYTFIVTTEKGQGSNIPYTSVRVTVHVTRHSEG